MRLALVLLEEILPLSDEPNLPKLEHAAEEGMKAGRRHLPVFALGLEELSDLGAVSLDVLAD